MAIVPRLVSATPADVFAVLADAWTYSNRVVGTSHMRADGPPDPLEAVACVTPPVSGR
jgi:hypothetical protein